MSSLGTVISCVCWLAWGRLCCWVPKAARAKTIIVKIHYQCNRKFWKVPYSCKILPPFLAWTYFFGQRMGLNQQKGSNLQLFFTTFQNSLLRFLTIFTMHLPDETLLTMSPLKRLYPPSYPIVILSNFLIFGWPFKNMISCVESFTKSDFENVFNNMTWQ